MNVLIFGASGKTGKLTVERALAAGHAVTVFLHTPGDQPAKVRVLTGDAADPEAVRNAVADQDAVIDSIGGKTPYKATDLETTAARNIVAAMQKERVRRLIVVSMMGIGNSLEQAPFWYHYLLMPTYLHGATQDKTAMEAAVTAGGLDFVIARPPVLSDDPAQGSYTIIPAPATAHKITRADLAQFLVDSLIQNQYLGQAVVVANK